MKEDLHWLGITWQHEMRQFNRLPHYRAALDRLIASGYAYPCTCSRKDLAQSMQAPHDDDDEPIYTGACRPSHSGPRALEPGPCNYRFRIPNNETITFHDLHAGPQSFTAGVDFGDFLIWRKPLSHNPEDTGLPSYQLACVVDDAATSITEVVRGRDLLKSTARQILLQRALGYSTPQYFHCDLLRDELGVRLAKRHDALALRSLREQGLSPAQVLARFSL